MSDSKSDDASAITTTPSNSRGIPAATFIEDVPSYLQSTSTDPERLLRQLQSLYGKYKFMESQLVSQQKSLLDKIPEITNALTSVRYIQAQRSDFTVHFELADSLFAQSTIPASTSTVLLWLGANVMLEYSLEDAEALLEKNLGNAETSLASLEADLAFLKDQITVSEVNIARVHNVNVSIKNERKKAEAQQAAGGASGQAGAGGGGGAEGKEGKREAITA